MDHYILLGQPQLNLSQNRWWWLNPLSPVQDGHPTKVIGLYFVPGGGEPLLGQGHGSHFGLTDLHVEVQKGICPKQIPPGRTGRGKRPGKGYCMPMVVPFAGTCTLYKSAA